MTQEQIAYNEGWLSKVDGLALPDCPYKDEDLEREWFKGWYDSERNMERTS